MEARCEPMTSMGQLFYLSFFIFFISQTDVVIVGIIKTYNKRIFAIGVYGVVSVIGVSLNETAVNVSTVQVIGFTLPSLLALFYVAAYWEHGAKTTRK